MLAASQPIRSTQGVFVIGKTLFCACALVLGSLAHAADSLETFAVHEEIVPNTRLLDGSVEAVRAATVNAEISGRVSEIGFDVDDFVKRGDVLVRFRDVEVGSRVRQAEASLAEARARLTEAEGDYRRIQKLHEQRLVSQSQLDNARAAYESARARVESARAQLTSAKEQRDYTEVKAPFSGFVTQRFVEVGESVSVGTRLFSGVSLEKLRVSVMVPQRLIERVRASGKARVVFGDGRAVDSESLTVYPYADAATHDFKVRVNLPPGVEGLYPGMFLKVAFDLGESPRMRVPLQTVAFRSELTGVYVVGEDGRVSLRQVRLGERHEDGRITVLAGLSPGERVAMDPIRAGVLLKAQAQARQQAEAR